jgi:hypothetical protein
MRIISHVKLAFYGMIFRHIFYFVLAWFYDDFLTFVIVTLLALSLVIISCATNPFVSCFMCHISISYSILFYTLISRTLFLYGSFFCARLSSRKDSSVYLGQWCKRTMDSKHVHRHSPTHAHTSRVCFRCMLRERMLRCMLRNLKLRRKSIFKKCEQSHLKILSQKIGVKTPPFSLYFLKR